MMVVHTHFYILIHFSTWDVLAAALTGSPTKKISQRALKYKEQRLWSTLTQIVKSSVGKVEVWCPHGQQAKSRDDRKKKKRKKKLRSHPPFLPSSRTNDAFVKREPCCCQLVPCWLLADAAAFKEWMNSTNLLSVLFCVLSLLRTGLRTLSLLSLVFFHKIKTIRTYSKCDRSCPIWWENNWEPTMVF